MAIQPIDLQTLYSQLGTVSKTVVHQQQGAQLQNAIQQEELSKQLLEKRKAVEAASAEEGGPIAVKDRKENASADGEQKRKKEHTEEQAQGEEKKVEVITDPRLGRHIDVSG